jgi:hypothetical protein
LAIVAAPCWGWTTLSPTPYFDLDLAERELLAAAGVDSDLAERELFAAAGFDSDLAERELFAAAGFDSDLAERELFAAAGVDSDLVVFLVAMNQASVQQPAYIA